MKTIIIGNGSTLLGKGLGAEIDKFERVIRLNLFKIDGFELDLGTKTNIHVLNGKDASELKAPRAQITYASVRTQALWEEKLEKKAIQLGMRRLPKYYPLVIADVGGIHRDPTLGLKAISYWLFRADSPLYIANFDFGETGHYWNQAHRHQKHSWQREKELVEELILRGLIKKLDIPHVSV